MNIKKFFKRLFGIRDTRICPKCNVEMIPMEQDHYYECPQCKSILFSPE